MPDVVVNVVDASNIERNLYLTTQVIDMNLRTVMALNMYDELQHKGDKLDTEQLGKTSWTRSSWASCWACRCVRR